MFVGHAALAFAIVGLAGHSLGWSRERAVSLAVIAAVAATLPDLDMLVALPGLVAGSGSGLVPVEAFWDGAAAHRSVTHSLLVAGPIAGVIGLVAAGGHRRSVGLGVALATGSVLVAISTGKLVVVAPFVLGAVGLGFLAGRLPVGWQVAGLAAGIGLFTHPFGDLVTGDPPWLLYPAGLEVFTGRIVLAADPTLHLLAAFFLEIGAIWLGLYTLSRLHDRSLAAQIKPHAAVGATFAFAIFLIPAPTLGESYQFVFGALTMGAIGLIPRDRRAPLSWITTGLAAVTLAGIGYAVAYLIVAL
ncbi:MAG: metal-dependent hydrolase [Halodesulfurarchaeum sp.]|nr:metal-dependent hydrolase [Halodesulfurarchaeum sp.]